LQISNQINCKTVLILFTLLYKVTLYLKVKYSGVVYEEVSRYFQHNHLCCGNNRSRNHTFQSFMDTRAHLSGGCFFSFMGISFFYCTKCCCRIKSCTHVLLGKLTRLMPQRPQEKYSGFNTCYAMSSLLYCVNIPIRFKLTILKTPHSHIFYSSFSHSAYNLSIVPINLSSFDESFLPC
jgi:hypothetical protein